MKFKDWIYYSLDPFLWCTVAAVISLALVFEMLKSGWDASFPIYVDYCSVCGYAAKPVAAHYRTLILYSLTGFYALYTFGNVFKNHLVAFYLGVVTVLGNYGISEFLYSFPQTLTGYTPFGNAINNIFYWCVYLFQLVVLYIFSTQKLGLTDRSWRGSLPVILLLGLTSVALYLASVLLYYAQLDSFLLFLLNYGHKAVLTVAFGVYLRGWKT